MKDLLLVLVLWINQHTPLHFDDTRELPRVERVDQAVLAATVLARPDGRLVPSPERRNLARHVRALYQPRTRVIQVDDQVDLDDPRGRALLVRELAYMIQFEQGAGRGCGSVMARNAMRVQQQYIAATLHARLVLGAEELLRLSPCRL